MEIKTPNQELDVLYSKLKFEIHEKLEEFKNVKEEAYFYELVYCLCTPMSKAENALVVQKILEKNQFHQNIIDLIPILSSPRHYIRFHNQKALYIEEAKKNFESILKVIKSQITPFQKREILVETVKGFGYKEASHFLRNVGYRGFAILDRHILRNMVKFGQISENYTINSKKSYLNIEKQFVNLSALFNLAIEEFDLLLWAKETGKILK